MTVVGLLFIGLMILCPIIFVVIYYFVYKHNINKSLERTSLGLPEEGGRLPALGTFAKVVAVIIIIVVVIRLSDNIQMVYNRVNTLEMIITDMREEQPEANEKLLEEIKKQNSLILKADVDYGSFKPEDESVEIKLTVIPKEISDKDEIWVNVYGVEAKLNKESSGSFSGSLFIPLFADTDRGITYSIKGADSTRTGILDEVIDDLDEYYYTNVLLTLNGECAFEEYQYDDKENKLSVKVSGEIYCGIYEESQDELTDLSVHVAINGEQVEKYDIYPDYEFAVDSSYKIQSTDTVEIYAQGKDK